MLGGKLIRKAGFSTAVETRTLELLKLRFAGTALHHCDVMLRDLQVCFHPALLPALVCLKCAAPIRCHAARPAGAQWSWSCSGCCTVLYLFRRELCAVQSTAMDHQVFTS